MSARLRKVLWLVLPKINREATLHTWNGLLTFNRRDHVGKILYVQREFEKQSMLQVVELLDSLRLRKRGLVIDIGANIGMIAIGFVVNRLFAKALAFEPDPYNFRLLTANVRQNHLDDRVSCFNVALSAEDGTADLELSTSNYGDHRIRGSAAPASGGFYREETRRTISIPVRRFDSVAPAEKLHLEEAGLVWVDIQGHEGHFLRGAKSLLARDIPIVTEFWPYAIMRSGMSAEEYTSLVTSNFSRYVHLLKDHHESRPISAFSELFDVYRKPREMGTVMLLK